ncbi:MAG TPA: hypothetical protein VEN12_09470 [Verrucomicrobiae bacterium]|nr:hypothetical protein [Verrucomicrobiae bacterium]
MNPYENEDMMWQRLKDVQREAENSRLYGPHPHFGVAHVAALLGRRVWQLAGLAMRRPPRRHAPIGVEDDRSASDAA